MTSVVDEKFAGLFRSLSAFRADVATGWGGNSRLTLVFAAKARLGGFKRRQARAEIAAKTPRGRGVGMIVRADKSRFNGFAVPGTRPLVQALFVH